MAHEDDQRQDEVSLGLYDSSFETISDTGEIFVDAHDVLYLPDKPHGGQESTSTNITQSDSRVFPNSSGCRGMDIPNRSDIDLPDLKSPGDDFESVDLSIGELSPIKMIYTRVNTPQIDRALLLSSAIHEDIGSAGSVGRNSGANNAWTNQRSNPFFVLRSVRKAFLNVRFLLPCLEPLHHEANTVNVSEFGSIRHYKERKDKEELNADLVISTRRVESAICAFGGTLKSSSTNYEGNSFANQSIIKNPMSSWNGHKFSLEPPSFDNVSAADQGDHLRSGNSDHSSNDETKMKYRCKRCGQLKQNHICPDQHLLQRSIGVMVYPAINAFSAAEPGVIAPALSKMNNFISYDDSDHGEDPPSDHVTQQRTLTENKFSFVGHSMTVTPDSLRGPIRGLISAHFHSPQSSLSAHSAGSEDQNVVKVGPSLRNRDRPSLKRSHSQTLQESSTLLHRNESTRSAPFVASISLRPEQYRAVTPSTNENKRKLCYERSSITISESTIMEPSKVPYQYPAVPLSFAERKRLSDTLFYLSQEIPSVTSDCANILRAARQRNQWDTAVAELLTQVVIALYCGEGDLRLDGLQQYLLKLGISC